MKILATEQTPKEKEAKMMEFCMACAYGTVWKVKSLIANGPQNLRVDPSDLDNLGVRMASKYGWIDVVEYLLRDARVDPSALNNNAFKLAYGSGHVVIVDRLLQDPRVLWYDFSSMPKSMEKRINHVKKAKQQWYADRMQKFSDLHTELVATVMCIKLSTCSTNY